MNNNTSISVTYPDERLRTLVEEYITMQKHEFTFGGLCSYVLYWAKEEGFTLNESLYESDLLHPNDSKRVSKIIQQVAREGRINVICGDDGLYVDETQFEKVGE